MADVSMRRSRFVPHLYNLARSLGFERSMHGCAFARDGNREIGLPF